MYVYHVVTDRPMVLGQRIIFDENNRSGVYQRVMEREELVKDVYAHPEKYPLPLEHHLDVAIRELALEQVRREKFPEMEKSAARVCTACAGPGISDRFTMRNTRNSWILSAGANPKSI